MTHERTGIAFDIRIRPRSGPTSCHAAAERYGAPDPHGLRDSHHVLLHLPGWGLSRWKILPVSESSSGADSRAAKLSSVQIGRPPRAIEIDGDGMVAGLCYQNVRALEKIVRLLKDEMGAPDRSGCHGGFANLP